MKIRTRRRAGSRVAEVVLDEFASRSCRERHGEEEDRSRSRACSSSRARCSRRCTAEPRPSIAGHTSRAAARRARRSSCRSRTRRRRGGEHEEHRGEEAPREPELRRASLRHSALRLRRLFRGGRERRHHGRDRALPRVVHVVDVRLAVVTSRRRGSSSLESRTAWSDRATRRDRAPDERLLLGEPRSRKNPAAMSFAFTSRGVGGGASSWSSVSSSSRARRALLVRPLDDALEVVARELVDELQPEARAKSA